MSHDVTTSRKRSSPTFHFAAGLTTGLLTASLLQPADLLKTRLQQPARIGLLPTLRSITTGPNASGLRGLWRGTLPSVIRTGLGSALYFSSLNTLRSYVGSSYSGTSHGGGKGGVGSGRGSSSLPQLTRTANLLTGAVARAAAGFVLMPATVVKVRYESSFYAYGSILGACKSIVKAEGVRGLFKGAGATAARDAPYAGLYMVFYEEGKKWFGAPFRDRALGITGTQAGMVNFTAGVMAAGFATAFTNPFDAVKTRLQLVPRTYGNMFVTARRMVREDGWRSLMDGLGLRMGRKAASSALAWTCYEELIRRAERSLGDRL